MQYKAIIFDFDGTLVISNQVKIDTYFEVFQEYCIDNQLITKILKKHPELNRFETISKIIQESSKKLDAWIIAEQYSREVQQRVRQANNLKYAESLLDYLVKNNIKVFLSSNTPFSFLQDLIKKRGWSHYFLSINGYPMNKADTAKNLVIKYHLKLNDCVVIGDGESDRESALLNGISFIKVESNSLLPIIKKLGIKYSIDNGVIKF